MKRALAMFGLILALAGCASSSVTGKRTAELQEPITKLQIHILEADFGPIRHQGVHAQHRLMAVLPGRVDALFAANGIENKTNFVEVKARRKSPIRAEEGYPYFLVIQPKRVGFFRDGDNVSMEISAYIFDMAARKSVWKGNIHFHKPTFAKVDEEVADELVKALLLQLAKDEVIKADMDKLMPKK